HAQLRNVIEHIFGVIKREFKMVAEACEYSIRVQCAIPLALSLVHNFLRTHDPERCENELQIGLCTEPGMNPHGDNEAGDAGDGVRGAQPQDASARRDQIAEAMWAQYQEVLRSRGD
ncbi:uncharacterized protein BXZ73DRAFT_53983, partial [Epithele typhae]|uniref:uncharacterized protein n=1 Tax=Epithele typhae TaxID=378194 RepID=UPI00200756BE